jgi:hypothetical protein
MLKATLHIVWINTPANFTPDNITLVKLRTSPRAMHLPTLRSTFTTDVEEKSGVIAFARQKEGRYDRHGTHGRKA